MYIGNWKNPTERIIKLLYKKDTGFFIDNDVIIKKLRLNDEVFFDNLVNDLIHKDYVETNILPPDIPYPKDLGWNPGIRITQKGREYYKETSRNIWQSIKNNLAIAISVLTLWFSLIQPMVCKEKKTIPVFDFKITNKSKSKVDLHKLNVLTIWLPAGNDRNYQIAEFEIQNMGEIDSILLDQSRNFKGKIQNENRYFEYFKNGDCDFTIAFNNLGENISNHIPFSKDGFTEDTLKYIIE